MLDKQNQDFVTVFGGKLKNSFPELKNRVEIFFLIRNAAPEFPWLCEPANREWNGYSEIPAEQKTADSNIWMTEFLDGLNSEHVNSVDEVKTVLDKMSDQHHFVYLSYESCKMDSRIEEKGCGYEKDLIWLVRSDAKSEILRILFAVIMEKTKERLADLFFLSCWQESVYIEEQLFQYVQEKETVMKDYVQKIFGEAKLPAQTLISLISAQKYEKRELYSRIYFGDCPKDKMEVLFEEKDHDMWAFSTENMRFIRKMLEIADRQMALVVGGKADDQIMKGIGGIEEKQGFQIIFGGYLKWTLVWEGEELICYEAGNYHLPGKGLKEETYIKKIRELHLAKEGRIISILQGLKEQSHGTSIVFLDKEILEKVLSKLEEGNRLCRVRAIPVYSGLDETDREESEKQKELFRKLMVRLSAIDGALIADYEGNIHAIGAILDGVAVVRANVSRGARFNSLQNYVNWLVCSRKCKQDQCFAVIISEDGMIDVEIAEEKKWIGE